MPGNIFGKIFRISTFGESHGAGLGVMVEGCPAGFKLDIKQIQEELNRRLPGQSSFVSPRKEKDELKILSGIDPQGKTLGTPLAVIIFNQNFKQKDYLNLNSVFRPSHADYSYFVKYGISPQSGGGRASARETVGRVIGGAIAKQILKKHDCEIIAYVKQIYNIIAEIKNTPNRTETEESPIRCPDKKASELMEKLILKTKKEGDSLGGIIECVIKNPKKGLGEPVFDKLEADLAKAILSIPSCLGFEFGAGFSACLKKGSENNDPFIKKNNKIICASNNSGGIQGGISNGMDIIFRAAFKPVSSISKEQKTVDLNGKEKTIKISGRHDSCVLPRAVPIVEAMAALVILDHLLLQKINE